MKTKSSGSGLVKELTPCSKAATLEKSSHSVGGWWCLQLSKSGRNSNRNILFNYNTAFNKNRTTHK